MVSSDFKCDALLEEEIKVLLPDYDAQRVPSHGAQCLQRMTQQQYCFIR